MLGVNYFSVYRLIQRGKLKVCRALRGKLLVPRTELLRLLKTE
jgi:predicted site-specific integrase-resolvase